MKTSNKNLAILALSSIFTVISCSTKEYEEPPTNVPKSSHEILNLNIMDNPDALMQVSFDLKQNSYTENPTKNYLKGVMEINTQIKAVITKGGELQMEIISDIPTIDGKPAQDVVATEEKYQVKTTKMLGGQLYMFNASGGLVHQIDLPITVPPELLQKLQTQQGSNNITNLMSKMAGAQVVDYHQAMSRGKSFNMGREHIIGIKSPLPASPQSMQGRSANSAPAYQITVMDTLKKQVLTSQTFNEKEQEMSYAAYKYNNNNQIEQIHQELIIDGGISKTGKALRPMKSINNTGINNMSINFKNQ